MDKIFHGTSKHPQHISVGAVVLNDRDEICCHKFNKGVANKFGFNPELKDDLYLLMRETLEAEESLEDAAKRGLLEEFGMKAEIVDYVGTIISHYTSRKSKKVIEKTTIYFLCRYINQDDSLREEGVEGSAEIVWRPFDFLISQMLKQGKDYGRSDLDESGILERVKRHYL